MTDKLNNMVIQPYSPFSFLLHGVFLILWGFWWATPAWNVTDKSEFYTSATEVAPEWAWGSAAMLIGLTMIIAGYRYNRKWLRYATGAAAILWSIIGMFYAIGDYEAPAVMVKLYLAAFNWLAFGLLSYKVTENLPYNNRTDII